MALRNHSTITEFFLLQLSANHHIEVFLFVLFLVIYLLTIMGNLMMLLVIRADFCLHTPMYFFLSHLSFIDLCFSSVTVPKMLENLLSQKKTISVEGCLTQVFFVFITGGTELLLLCAMAYDRYAAICHPLLYGQIMSKQLYMQLVWGSWGLSFLDALINILLAMNMVFCEAQIIHHFICEMPSILPLSCSDVSRNITVLLCSTLLHGLVGFHLVFISYACIICTILSISSTSGRSKVFSTCSSHLTAVTLYYGSGVLRHLMPNSGSLMELMFSVQYSVITPMLNPLIYSLKNKEVKAAVRRTLKKYLLHIRMSWGNRTTVNKFILLGLSADPKIQALLFVLFLGIYLLLLLLVIWVDFHLHTPMYFFLSHLSFLDLCFSSTTVSKLLENLLSQTKIISVGGCLAQVFFLFDTGGTEACLLAVMAYDLYVAICHSLLYGQVMSNKLCKVWGSWSLAFLDALINILLAMNLDFCGDKPIPYYSYELPSLFPLSCSDASTNFTVMLCSTLLHELETCVLIIFSYTLIVSTILSISSSTGKSKAFSTCSSHFTIVLLFYGSAFLHYVMPNSDSPLELLFSVQYSAIMSLVNPLIYSLKNNKVKAAVKRTLRNYLQYFR
ncbi:LOW QUALITY PROTEIN: olfactory receptor 1E16-like [Dugong dugon]